MSSKKPAAKKAQEPTEEQVIEVVEAIPGVISGSVEVGRPMAAPEPSIEDRVAALEKAMIKADEFCTKHNRYHFGRVSQG
jgi:hypothetical protein